MPFTSSFSLLLSVIAQMERKNENYDCFVIRLAIGYVKPIYIFLFLRAADILVLKEDTI